MVHAIIHTITLNTSGTAGKCIEGREFIIALPESFVEYKADDVVRLFTDSVHKRYDVECSAALHHNKKMTNYHIHLVWNRMVDAIGIVSKSGRYGGTYAHTDIAFEFASWISPEFKLYIIKDYQRLKKDEADRLAIGWDVKRELSKINYCIHTDAVKEFLITPTLSPQEMAYTYASEADILNMALFGKTAAQWRTEKGIKGKTPNIRDFASAEELIVLINLEDTNADLIRQEVPKIERLKILREKAYRQLELLRKNQDTIAALKKNLIEDTETNG
ncbi:MAG: KilA-N domain-containing protein [Lachnospiraceae bacterium]|nr:KilA-N domain-containing protein [Lachnospiraceae bacterium]